MNKPRSYTLPELFGATQIGFTFEFYSSKDTNFIVENLSKLTTKNVILTNSDSYKASYNNAILVKEYEDKKPRYSLKLGQENYNSSITLMKEVLNWISETSDCTIDTLMRVNLSFDNKHLKTLVTIPQMDTNKLILKIDESYIYDRFAFQEDSPYCISSKQLTPMSETVYTQDMVKNINYVIGTPKENYYGINFKNYDKGILEFNYIGGLDYAEKQKEILEVVNYYVLKTYQSINEDGYNEEEIKELEKLTNEFYKIQDAYYDMNSFNKLFPNIKVLVNARLDEQLIKTFWPKIRNVLFETVINNKMVKGEFNYDADISVFQLRNAYIKSSTLNNFDLVKCDIQGIVKNCNFIVCEVDNARLYNSKIVKSNKIHGSYLHRVTIDNENSIENCFVENNNEMLNCNIKSSIIKFAGIGKLARLDESSTIIDREEILHAPATGIQIEEIHDYKWFRKMADVDDGPHVYGNEYKKIKR